MKVEHLSIKGSLPKPIGWMMAGLLFVLPLTMMPMISSPFQLPQVSLFRSGTFFLLFLWAISLLGQSKIRILFDPLGKQIGMFLLVCLVSTCISNDRFTSLFGSHQLWFWGLWSLMAYAGIYLMAVNAPSMRRLFLGAFLTAATTVSLYALLQRLGWDPFWKSGPPAYPFTATLGNPNYLGVFTAMAVPIALFFSVTGNRFQRVLSVLSACLNFLICALALTRGAWLGLAFGLLLWIVLLRRQWKSVRVTLFILFALFVALGAYAFWPTSLTGSSPVLDKSRTLVDPQESSTAARLSLWRSAARIVLAHPILGVGLDRFGDVFPRYQEIQHRRRGGAMKIATNAHNEPLQVLTTLGLIGFAAYCWIWFSVIRLFATRWRKAEDNERFLLASVAASIVALQIHAFFNFSITATSAHLWCWFGLLSTDTDQLNAREFRVPLPARSVLLAVSLGLFLFVSDRSARHVLADWHTFRGEKEQSFMRTESALIEFDTARDLSTRYYPAYVRSANARVTLARKEKDPVKRRAYIDQAIEICSKAFDLFPLLPEAPHNLGWTYCLLQEMLGDKTAEKGSIYLKRSVELAPMYPEFWTNYGHALELAGKPDSAQKAFAKALEILPTYPPAMRKLAAYMPKKEVNFVEQELLLKNVPLGKPVKISKAAGKSFKLMNLEAEDFQVTLQAASVEETPYFLPKGYRPLGNSSVLQFDQKIFLLKSDTIWPVDGTIQLPDDPELRGKKFGIVILARLTDFQLPAGAFARLLIETEGGK